MKHAEIISEQSFDWDRGLEASGHVKRKDGSINWKAASMADPGATKCPECEEYFWAEAELLRCTECDTVFNSDTKEIIPEEEVKKITGWDG